MDTEKGRTNAKGSERPDQQAEDSLHIQDWNLDYKDAVYRTIEEEDAKGVALRDPDADVPSIKSIKEKVLRRCYSLIEETSDPAKLAVVYKTLSEFESADDKKDKSVLDAINEAVKPLTPKKKSMTMLDRMKAENKVGGAKGEDEEKAEE